MAYVCEKSVGAGRSCDFRSGKVILQQEVARAEMQKLLESGRTSLLKGFVSNRTRRKFSAFLVRDARTGKVGFEFEARAGKPAAKSSTKTTAKVGAGETAANEPVVKKAAAKKPVAKKAARVGAGDTATKAAPKKPAAKKPAAKKASAKKA
jgi:DNA topoisomerase-3